MKLSTRARYGLKALIDLGLHSAGSYVLSEIWVQDVFKAS